MATLITVGGSSSTGAGATFGDLIEKVYRRVMGGIRERTVQLVYAVDGNSDYSNITLTGSQISSIAPGVILAVELELMYVTAWNSVTAQATVERGYYGSVTTSHDALTLAYINPRYSRYDIGVAINDDLRSMSAPDNGLFRVGVAEITYNPVYQGYDLGDLPANFIDVIEVRYKIAPPYRTFPPIKRWKVIRWNSQNTDAAFPSGNGIIIYEPGWPGLPLFVTYTAPFIRLVDTADSLLNTPATNDEAPPYNGYNTYSSVSFTGTVTNGSSAITSVSSTAGLFPNMLVSGTGIASGTYIISINASTHTVTISNSATANSTGTIDCANPLTIPNLTPTMIDIPPLGAEIDLTQPREISRNFMESQPDPRKAQEVAPGSVAGSVNALVARRAQRIAEEASRLQRQYTRIRGW